MRILTVRQPWAWAIVHGGKDVENRTRNIAGAYRGPVAIHAGLGWSEQGAEDWEVRRAIESESLGWPADDGEVWASDHAEASDPRFIRGAVIGIVGLTGVHTDDDCWDRDMRRVSGLHRSDPEAFAALRDNGARGLIGKVRHCSPWAMVDHRHLCLDRACPLTQPIPAKGRLGLWRPDDALGAAIRKQVIA